MKPMTAAALRRVLADLPDDTEVIDAATGRALADVDTDTGQAVLMFLEATPAHHRRAVNNVVGEFHGGSLMQIGGDYHGDIRL
mgnify:CR=1 FL=1